MTNEKVHPELLEIAERINWFDNPKELLENENRFLCYFMQYCIADDIEVVYRHFSQKQFRKALDEAPRGLIDARSRAYWNTVLPQSD